MCSADFQSDSDAKWRYQEGITIGTDETVFPLSIRQSVQFPVRLRCTELL